MAGRAVTGRASERLNSREFVHAQVVIAERKSIFNNLVEQNGYAFGFGAVPPPPEPPPPPREAEASSADRCVRAPAYKVFPSTPALRIHLAAGLGSTGL